MGVSVVTGASRGIGRELARQLKARGANVVAVCRKSSPELDALGVRVEAAVDVTEPAAWSKLAERLAHDDIDLRTEMTRGHGMIEADESVRGLLQRIDELRLETTGRFLHQNGEVLPW